MVKLIDNNGRFNLTIPKDIIKKKNWKKGQDLLVNINEKENVEVSEI